MNGDRDLASPREGLITVRQPFASAIFLAGKDVENRSWPTNYRGRLWIHAATKLYPRSKLVGTKWIGALMKLSREHPWDELPRGCIIGHVYLYDVIEPGARQRFHQRSWGAWGMYHWMLEEPVLLDSPIPFRGRQSLSLVDPASFLGVSPTR